MGDRTNATPGVGIPPARKEKRLDDDETGVGRPTEHGIANGGAQACITVFNKAGGALTKKIRLAADGTLERDGSECRMSNGSARRTPIANLSALAEIIDGRSPIRPSRLARCATGCPTRSGSSPRRSSMDRQTPSPAPATRSSTARTARRSCCWILTAVECRQDIADRLRSDFWAVLMEVVPDLRHAARLIRASTSAGLFNSDTGESLEGSGGLHGYVIARDGADAERFLTALHDRCWLHGLGWIKLGAAGQMLDRSIIDRSVAAPERLVFEATPILSKPLGQDQESRRPIVHDGEVLDTQAACPSLTAEEQRRVEQLKAAARERIKPEAERVHEAYVEREAEEIVARTGISKKAAVAQVRSRCRGVLAVDAVLPFADKELEGCTVGDVLADPERFNGRVLADPIEGVSYGRTTAMVMLRRSDG